MPIFSVSSNFPLDMLHNGCDYEVSSQSLLFIVPWSEKKLQKTISTKFKNKQLNTDICSGS